MANEKKPGPPLEIKGAGQIKAVVSGAAKVVFDNKKVVIERIG